MPNFSFDHDLKVITIDFTEAEYKVLSWQEEDPFAGIKQRVESKVEYAWVEAVREELRIKFNDPSVATMPADEETLIMESTRPSLRDKVENLLQMKKEQTEE